MTTEDERIRLVKGIIQQAQEDNIRMLERAYFDATSDEAGREYSALFAWRFRLRYYFANLWDGVRALCRAIVGREACPYSEDW